MEAKKAGPKVDESCFVHATAIILGDVEISEGSSIWPYAVIRGDDDSVRIGRWSNVQDCAVVHEDTGFPTSIGDRVTIGHGAVVHGCTIGEDCIIGIRSTILNGAVIGSGSIIGAGAVVTPGTKIPPQSMVLGIPGKVARTDPSFRQQAVGNAEIYVALAKEHKKGLFPYYRPL